MPLFSSRRTPPQEPVGAEPGPVQQQPRHSASSGSTVGSLFNRRKSVSPERPVDTIPEQRQHSSVFSSHRFSRNHEDPSITAAQQRVTLAEQAEKEADMALVEARTAVRVARDQVKQLEREAAEEARLAKIKQKQAKNISDRAKPLGRHGPF